MAEKEIEGKVNKLKRKFSRKSIGKTPVSTPAPSPVPEAASPVSGKSATLPLSYDSKSLALHESHSEGLFSKIRRRFRLGSKGKYDLKTYTENSPSKHKWLRRKSEETQPQSDESSLGLDPKNSVAKSNSVKTQRKTKSDKEEVILIRKDKRVSVICKAENGESEVIFSNVNSPDDDLSETVSEVEEDPYATISSVKDEIARSKSHKVAAGRKEVEVSYGLPGINEANGSSKPEKTDAFIDEYPYAKIDPNRKSHMAVSPSSLEAKNGSRLQDLRVRSQIEPDYESLEEIEQKKNELKSRRSLHSSSFEANLTGCDAASHLNPSAGLDPDYESLEEVKQRLSRSGMSSHAASHSDKAATADINGAYQTALSEKVTVGDHSHSRCNIEVNSFRLSPLLGASSDCRRPFRTYTSSSQGSRPVSMPSPHLGGRTSSASSPSALAPLAPSIDSSLPNDKPSHQQASPEEECLYDNPNIILRKQVSRSMTGTSTLTRRGQTNSEPPVIKTPAEEELVEKLSSLLAPPLPLRNYQKDEVNLRSGPGSARHSWSSQSSRNIEPGELIQAKDVERSPLASLTHSRENLLLKSVKDSLVSQVYERHELFSRSNGADILRKKENGTLERYLRKSSPKAVKSNRLLDKTRDYSIINITKGTYETTVCKPDSVVVKLSNGHGKDARPTDSCLALQSKHSQEIDIVSYCHELSESILEQVFKQCEASETNLPQSIFENTFIDDLKIVEDFEATPVIKNTEIQNGFSSSDFSNSQSNESVERYAKYVSTNGSQSSVLPEVKCETTPSYLFCSDKTAASNNKTDHGRENNFLKGVGTNQSASSTSEKTIHHDHVLYNMQGARPKVKTLLLDQTTKSSSPSHGYSKNNQALATYNGNGGSEPKTVGVKTGFGEFSQNSHRMGEFDPPALTELGLHNGIDNKFSQRKPKVGNEWVKKSEEDCNNQCFEKPGFSIQETVYINSDSGNEVELYLNKQATVHGQRNEHTSKVMKPIVYANPRLLENVINGAFKREVSLDSAYMAYGVFRWGRYFPAPNDNRQAVNAKLKAFMNFVIEMLFGSDRFIRNQGRIRKLQEEADRMQLKIEKRLKAVQDLPTFEDIRLRLLKTDAIDDWEPEKPRESYFDHPEGHKDLRWVTSELVRADGLQDPSHNHSEDESGLTSETHPDERSLSTQDLEVGDILHPEDPFYVDDEDFSVFDNRQAMMSLPTSSNEVLAEFLKLSNSRLKCKHCESVEESDSEDEMVTVESYAKTVSSGFCPQFPNHIGVGAVSVCRAFHGELAYTAYMRKHRPARKILNVPGPDSECDGPLSHLSWNNWCSLDLLFKKLVPHISPRLDFQHLLRTYAEFKHFILIDRKRNFKRKGCFVKKLCNNGLRCCRFEEFVFLKIIRDEIRHFSYVLGVSAASRDLFLEERDVGYSLLSLLRLVLQNVHKMRRHSSEEEVGVATELRGNLPERRNVLNGVNFRHSSFQKWLPLEDCSADLVASTGPQKFHKENFENFRFNCLSTTLRNWKSPQVYVRNRNVLAACRSMFAHSDTKVLDLAIKSETESGTLQEQQDFLESMEQLQLKEWYWGPISYEQATLILKDMEDGSFLVRDSFDQKYLLSLSFKSLGEVHHTRIEHARGLFSFWSQPESHGKATICEFIEKTMQNSRDGRFLYFMRPCARGIPPLLIRLLTPVSRNFRVATLKHLSRFVVRQSVRRDHLDHLPVPEKVKRYLKEKQYYVEIPDDDQVTSDGE